ncbi:MAG: hypothetical protein K8R68_11855, partial [Bacteroidales bacterium]|nr:hypothetical protein [Bacteroidales bacterium]
MKKFVLNGLAIIIIAGSSFAQKGTIKKAERDIIKTEKTDLKNSFKLPDYSQSESFNIKSTDSIELFYIGKSGNINSVRYVDQHCMAYDQDADAYMFTHRSDPDTYPGANHIIASISIDDGITWNPLHVDLDPNTFARYPSGAIYNPDNNTNIENCIGVFMGPAHQGVSWSHNYFIIMKLDGSQTYYELEQIVPNFSDPLYRYGLCTTDDGMFHGGGSAYNYGTYSYNEYLIMIANGTIHEETFTFTLEEAIIDLGQYLGTNTVGDLLLWGDTRMAWNNDGSIGYVFTNGVVDDLSALAGYQAIAFISTDQGDTWVLIETESLINHPAFEGYLEPNCQGNIIPAFIGTADGVVDMNNNLQLFSEVRSGTSSNPDSLTYFDPSLPSHLFNLTISDNGVEGIIWCDSVSANRVPSDSEYAYSPGANGVGWNNRLQASRTVDGSAYFAIWTDTEEPEQYNEENVNPDIYGWGKNLYSDNIEGPIAFTSDGMYWFTYVSTIAKTLINESGIDYIIGVSKTPTPVEWLTNTHTDPVSHYFVKGIEFSELVITGQEKNIIEK